ncbi:MAG: hypothetical protein VX229_07475 [Pseudomonadota bacterium]|nr:hypothetical protein [Pseudomonadota bacterium]
MKALVHRLKRLEAGRKQTGALAGLVAWFKASRDPIEQARRYGELMEADAHKFQRAANVTPAVAERA